MCYFEMDLVPSSGEILNIEVTEDIIESEYGGTNYN